MLFADYGQIMNRRHISTVRSFSRAVTQRVGIFADKFLGRNRPLAEARLVFEIGERGRDVRELRALLNLDSGYLSRLLRSLERQGLVQVVPGADDRRVRRALLTADGVEEWQRLNRHGDDVACTLLEPLNASQRQRLVKAMLEVEGLLALAATEIEPEDSTHADAKYCLQQYFAELAETFRQGFDLGRTISADPEELRPPRGVFLVARLDGQAIGCGALKVIAPGVAYIKRMWVQRSVRGVGLGQKLLSALEAQARRLQIHTLRLETNSDLPGAREFYLRNGFREVEPFNDEPYAEFWFEKRMNH